MAILETLRLNRSTHSVIRSFRIHTIRFKKLLENANILLDLFADGNEKLQGEYILDRHYVVSLIDRVIERLGMIVYDAAVLSQDAGADLYRQYDQQKIAAECFISGEKIGGGEDLSSGDDASSPPAMDPEYRLLSQAISWFHGKGDETVSQLMKKAMINGMHGIEKIKELKNDLVVDEIWLKKSESRIFLIDLWRDESSPKREKQSIEAFGSLPLTLILKEALNDMPSIRPHMEMKGEWIIVAGDNEITLLSVNPNFNLRLDATASGYEASDYIFVSIDGRLEPAKILPQGFHMEKNGSGYFCWKIDASFDAIKEDLISIGSTLFG